MDRGKDVVLHDPFRDQDGVFVVVSVPGHERDECVPAQSKLTQLGGRTIGNDVTLLDDVTHLHQRTLIDTGILVRALEFHQRVDIDARPPGFDFLGGADAATGSIDVVNDSGALRSEDPTSELQSLMRISYAVVSLKTKAYINVY